MSQGSDDLDASIQASSSEVEADSYVKDQPRRIKRRGIYLLPNLFTTGALFCGFYAITAAMVGKYDESAKAIFFVIYQRASPFDFFF